jgi:hypothetical protein
MVHAHLRESHVVRGKLLADVQQTLEQTWELGL